jgi:hypothetical protein
MCLYSDCAFHQPTPYLAYDEDISDKIRTSGVAATSVGLRRGDDFAILIGNASERTITTALRIEAEVRGTFRVRSFNSLRGAWVEGRRLSAEELRRGVPCQLERKGFWIVELEQET